MENRSNNPSEPCDICGDIGHGDFIMTCYNCREVKEHTYCAKICLQSRPDMWLCQVCRSSNRVLQISNPVEKDKMALTTDYGASSSKISSKFSGKQSSSPSKKHKPEFLAFPSPKRKRRTLRVPVDTEETHDQGSESSYPCAFHRID